MDKPKRRFEMTLTIGADDADEMERVLNGIVTEFGLGYLRSDFASGSPSSGFHGQTTERPEMTHERYVEALNAYLDKPSGISSIIVVAGPIPEPRGAE